MDRLKLEREEGGRKSKRTEASHFNRVIEIQHVMCTLQEKDLASPNVVEFPGGTIWVFGELGGEASGQ